MDDLTSELWTALILEQYHLMNRLIYRGANVNEQMDTRFDPVSTMLHYAAVMGDVQGVHLLINHGANCNARDSQAQAPLHWAVMANDRPDVVEVLINGGAVVDARDCYQSTPLHFSVGKHFNESAQKLIARGASVEAVDEEGRSILHTAVIYQNLSMVKVLISHGVNLEAEDTDGCTPLIYALENTDIFYSLLESNPIANSTLMHRHVTVFAPINQAFQRYHGSTENNLVLYHISNQPLRTDQFGQSLTSELEGNPPLWVTRRPGNKGAEEIYINNAKIIEGSNYESTFGANENEKKIQVLHKISEVLEPVQPLRSSELIYNPDAFQFLNQSENLKLGNHRVRTFHHRVKVAGKANVFSAEGKYTFFIPVDEGFKPTPRADKIDYQVIDGHVIPNHVLFTAPTPSNKPYETLAFGDNLKVTISFSTERSEKGNDKYYVKSDTLVGDKSHPTASVLSEIVKANIPVKNGVVHLIQNPLMVVDTTVQEFIQDKEDGPLYKFYEVIRDQGDEFMRTTSRYGNITLFAPRNAAWEEPGVKQILQDKKKIKELLNLHYVREYLPLDVIERKTIKQVNTGQPRTNLYFNVVEGPSGNNTVTVEGGGVNATIITANIGATNGIIHIIDRVLGVPYTTLLDKLKTDPTLNSTYHLGMRHNFNEQLNESKNRFTFFAPQDRAWQNLHIMQPSVYKKMFMADFAYHTKQILERHLVVGEAFTMKKLLELDQNGTMKLQTMRDRLDIKIRETGESYQIEWKGKKIKVIRPDVACTNGIIHVIDNVMLMESDVYVTGSGAAALIVPHIIILLVAKWLL